MDELINIVKGSMKDMTTEQKRWPVVAMLSGPAVCIEMIVRKASEESGIEMNWGYAGGRAFIHSLGDRGQCRKALLLALPESDLNPGDICP